MSCSTAWPMSFPDRCVHGSLQRPRGELVGMLLVVGCCLVGAGCRTGVELARPEPAALAEAVEVLGGPLSGDLAALYHLRVPSSGALRLAVVQAGGGGRMTVSEPFGSAVSVTAWSADGAARFFDLRHGCRVDRAGVAAALGVGAMPMPQAVRLLGGRMPVDDGDRVLVRDDGRLEVVGVGWRALVTVAASPWRVTAVDELTPDGHQGWRIRLDRHTGSVPGTVRIDGAERGWAELELLRLEWDTGRELAPEPELPACGDGQDNGP